MTAGILALTKLSKTAIATASDLAEVQNVVVQSFGEASDEIDWFAKNAMTAFGLTELQAKKTASTMMAMSNGMDINAQAGKIMAVNLTKLSGDMASFYNVSQDVAETALASVFTGETESLKKFGVVMTEANLNAFALSKGIKKAYNEMSQAEKVAIRYHYVMNATSKAQGDFARTSSSWANQLRVLVGQWGQLTGILGSGLIKVLTPVLGILNQILASLIAIANSFAKIFGGSGIAKVGMNLESASVGAGGLNENLEEANGTAKKLKKTIAGFDELNVLNGNANSGDGDLLGGAGAGGLEVYDYYGNLTDGEAQTASFNDILKTFNENITKYYDAIVAFGGQLGQKFNEAFKSIDWPLLGATVANGLNLVYDTANKFLTTVDWNGLGTSFATGLNSLFGNLDWDSIGQNFANKINAIGDIISGFVNTFDWAQLGTGLRTRFLGAINNIKWDEIGNAIGTGLTGVFTTLDKFLEGGVIEELGFKISTALNSALMSFDATAAGEAIHNLTSQLIIAFENIDWTLLAQKFREFIEGLDIIGIFKDYLSAKADTLGSIISGLFGVPEGVGDALGSLITSIQLISTVLGFIIPSAQTLANLSLIAQGNIPIISGLLRNLFGVFTGLGASIKTLVAEFGLFGGIKSFLGTFITDISTGFANLGIKLGAAWTTIKTTAIGAATAIKSTVLAAFTGLKTGLIAIGGAIKTAVTSVISFIIANPIVLIIAAIVALVALIAIKGDEIQKVLQKVNDWLTNIFTKNWEEVFGPVLGGILNLFAKVFGDIWKGINEILNGVINFIRGIFTGDWKRAWEGVKGIFKGIWDSLVGVVKAPINLIIGLINGLVSAIASGVNAVIRNINKLSWEVPDWVPLIGGSTFGFNLKTLTAPKIPYLANGGIITEPTVAMMGEYAGAYNNPEIVTPQSLLQQTIENSNQTVVDALIQQTRQLLAALEEMDMSVSIGDETIAQAANRGNLSYKRRTGRPLFA